MKLYGTAPKDEECEAIRDSRHRALPETSFFLGRFAWPSSDVFVASDAGCPSRDYRLAFFSEHSYSNRCGWKLACDLRRDRSFCAATLDRFASRYGPECRCFRWNAGS